MRRRSPGELATCVIAAGVLLLGCSRSEVTPPGLPSKAAESALRIPLATSVPGSPLPLTLAEGSWALVPMGKFAEPDNTFWQLFVMPAPGSPWTLATPEGVADNGGLTIATDDTGAVVGVDVSQHLGFSPLASTVSDGKSWSPAVLPRALTPVPQALAIEPGGHILALLGKTGWTIDSSDNGGGSTSYWSSGPQIARASLSFCHVIAVTAVAYGSNGLPLAGATCSASNYVGVFERYPRSWQVIGGPVPAAAFAIVGSKDGSATEVQRVWTSGTSVIGLAEAVSKGGTSCLFGFRRSGDGTWTTSAVLGVPPSEHLVATGYGPGGSVFVVLTDGHSLIAELLSGSRGTWSKLATPPVGTQTLVLGPGGLTEAFVVNESTLIIDGLNTKGTWAQRQVIHVPIELGSSS